MNINLTFLGCQVGPSFPDSGGYLGAVRMGGLLD